MVQEAMFYKRLENNKVQCLLCSHYCKILPGKRGICRVREDQEGVLYTLNYRKLIAANIDPIEKKPLFHFYPGSKSYSVAAMGCNFRCLHCQNWSISQPERDIIEGQVVSPERIVQNALDSDCLSISYTYTEPTIFYETALEIARLARNKGLKNIFVTNGYISPDALNHIAPYLDAANIDLKAMSDTFYRKVCGARLEPVLDRIKQYYELGIWVEITTLIIPGYNDEDDELGEIAQFIADIDKEIPWHISAFYPTYKLNDAPPTPVSTLQRAYKVGKDKGLHYVYEGNVGEGENTFCPSCGKTIINRKYFSTNNKIKNGKCPFCGEEIRGIRMSGENNTNQ